MDFTAYVDKLGVPLTLCAGLCWALWKLVHELGAWLGVRVVKLEAFLAPLVIRLVDATEANSRSSEATLAMLSTLNQTIAWNHDQTTELFAVFKQAHEHAVTRVTVLEERVNQALPEGVR